MDAQPRALSPGPLRPALKIHSLAQSEIWMAKDNIKGSGTSSRETPGPL